MQDLKSLSFVGIDTHKDFHSVRLTDCFSRSLDTFDVRNDTRYFKELTTRIKTVSDRYNLKPVFGLEDTQCYGQKLARFLIATGNYVKEIPPVKTERKRAKSSHPDKSDPEDAGAIAKILTQDFDKLQTINSFDELHLSIREFSNQREALIKEQTKIKNRLHSLIYKQYPQYQRMFKDTFSKSALAFWEKFPHPSYMDNTVKGLVSFLRSKSNKTVSTKAAQRILSLSSNETGYSQLDIARTAVLLRLLRHLRFLQKEISFIEKELMALVPKTGLKLEILTGVNTVTAGKLISYIGDILRFASSSKLAKCAGIAPIDKSSGKKLRHRKCRGGRRRLHCTIYYIALSQIGVCKNGKPKNVKAREYYLRKIAEGKSKKEALTCLMRRLCDIIYAMMRDKSEYRP